MVTENERLMASHATAVIREGFGGFNTPERRRELGHALVVAVGIPRAWSSVPEEFVRDLGVEVMPTDGFALHAETGDVRIIGLWRRSTD